MVQTEQRPSCWCGRRKSAPRGPDDYQYKQTNVSSTEANESLSDRRWKMMLLMKMMKKKGARKRYEKSGRSILSFIMQQKTLSSSIHPFLSLLSQE